MGTFSEAEKRGIVDARIQRRRREESSKLSCWDLGIPSEWKNIQNINRGCRGNITRLRKGGRRSMKKKGDHSHKKRTA